MSPSWSVSYPFVPSQEQSSCTPACCSTLSMCKILQISINGVILLGYAFLNEKEET